MDPRIVVNRLKTDEATNVADEPSRGDLSVGANRNGSVTRLVAALG